MIIFLELILLTEATTALLRVSPLRFPRSNVLFDNRHDFYDGPVSAYDEMEAGCCIEDIGIEVMVGKSVFAPGLGLFVKLNDDVEEVHLPRGTPICAYSKGQFVQYADGDKTVGYSFTDINVGVIYNKKTMPLYEAVNDIAVKNNDLTRSVLGHLLFYNEVR